MLYLTSEHTDPSYNLALEEYVFNEVFDGEDVLMLWQNEPAVIIGKHQNAVEEVNTAYVEENNIRVVRRLSGGGAVYHDLGNLNFTFIVHKSKGEAFDFRAFVTPIIKLLKSLGVHAEFTSRNDITINGKKFSGNAQYVKKDKILHHGTLLFNTDISPLVRSLTVADEKIISKGIKSVRSRVTNISDHLDGKMTVLDFKKQLMEYFKLENETFREYHLDSNDEKQILNLMNSRYRQWDWNYGKSPKFTVQKKNRFEGGVVDTRIDVRKGVIQGIKFYGDFFSSRDLSGFEKKLIGTKYTKEAVKKTLEKLEIEDYFIRISSDEVSRAIIS